MKENILYTVEILISVSCTIIYEYVLNIQKQDFTVVDSQLHVVFWIQLQFNQTFMKNELSIKNVQIFIDNHLKYY